MILFSCGPWMSLQVFSSENRNLCFLRYTVGKGLETQKHELDYYEKGKGKK